MRELIEKLCSDECAGRRPGTPGGEAARRIVVRAFRDAGGSTFNVWGWVARDDAWANSDSVIELEHPKYRAIRDFARALRDGTAATRPE